MSVLSLVLKTIYSYWCAQNNRKVGFVVEKETLTKIIFAPVNLFFDITPLGKIYQIFINEMHAIYGEAFDKYLTIVERLSGMIVLITVIFTI